MHFDVLRLHGARGAAVAECLAANAEPDAVGPVVCEATGFRMMYFLLPPGSVRERQWPADIQQFTGPRASVYIGVPALTGNTWPLHWYSPPTAAAPFVEPKAMLRALAECPVPPPRLPYR